MAQDSVHEMCQESASSTGVAAILEHIENMLGVKEVEPATEHKHTLWALRVGGAWT